MTETLQIRIAKLRETREKALQCISDLCEGRKRWVMCVPPQDDDPDLLLGGVIYDQGKLITDLEAQLTALREEKSEAYSERNHIVAALAHLFPSGIARTNIPGWDEEWHGCVYIDLPTGQISYHYHDSEHQLFADLPAYKGQWDGHDKATVHQRLKSAGEKS